MKSGVTLLLLTLLLVSLPIRVLCQQTEMANGQGLGSEFDRLFSQIVAMRDADLEVPQALYDRYFELQRNLYPIPDERHPAGRLDQAMDGCPGTVITQPPPGQILNFLDAGWTNNAHNNCTFPRCRAGREGHQHTTLAANKQPFLR